MSSLDPFQLALFFPGRPGSRSSGKAWVGFWRSTCTECAAGMNWSVTLTHIRAHACSLTHVATGRFTPGSAAHGAVRIIHFFSRMRCVASIMPAPTRSPNRFPVLKRISA
jgi:hypothetical protein